MPSKLTCFLQRVQVVGPHILFAARRGPRHPLQVSTFSTDGSGNVVTGDEELVHRGTVTFDQDDRVFYPRLMTPEEQLVLFARNHKDASNPAWRTRTYYRHGIEYNENERIRFVNVREPRPDEYVCVEALKSRRDVRDLLCYYRNGQGSDVALARPPISRKLRLPAHKEARSFDPISGRMAIMRKDGVLVVADYV